jgi:hypothetical protein
LASAGDVRANPTHKASQLGVAFRVLFEELKGAAAAVPCATRHRVQVDRSGLSVRDVVVQTN